MLGKFTRAALLVAAGKLLLGAAPYVVTPYENQVLAGTAIPASGDELVITKGQVFHSKPVGQQTQAQLGDDVQLIVGGENLTLKTGTLLLPAREVTGSAAPALKNADVYCAGLGSDLAQNKRFGGAFGALLVRRVAPANPRMCLVDGDRDGKVEQTFLLETRLEDNYPLHDIAPIPVTLTRDAPLPGESEIRLRFAGQVGLVGNLGFDLEIVESGKPLSFTNGRTVISAGKLPTDVTIMGARFTVLSYDRGTKAARIRWLGGFAPGTYSVEKVRTTTYIPIYIPH